MGCCCSSVPLVDPVWNQPEWLSEYKTGPYSTTKSDGKATIRYSSEGLASKETCPSVTVPALFLEAKEKRGDKVALRLELPTPEFSNGKWAPPIPLTNTRSYDSPSESKEPCWHTWTWNQYYDIVWKAAKSLIAIGVQPHDAVNVYGFNSPEWFFSQMAAIFVGGKVAGIYPNDNAAQVQFKSLHSGGTVAMVENASKLKKFADNIDKLPDLKAIVVWSATEESAELKREAGDPVSVYTWKSFMDLGSDVKDSAVQERIDGQDPGHCCGLIYTSGTTGKPKAVMISHDNLLFAGSVFFNVAKLGQTEKEHRIISYLPLSHIAAMMLDTVAPMYMTARAPAWCSVAFARPYDLKAGSIGDRLRSVKPTIFLGVPRVWEKISDKIRAAGKSTTGMKKKIAIWAKGKGLRHQMNCMVGGSGKKECCYCLADKLVFQKVLARLGLEECEFGITGAAPISVDTLSFFGALGLQINEVYGMSESTGVTTASIPETHMWGSVGFAPPGMEVKIFTVEGKEKTEVDKVPNFKNVPEASQGEICFRGRHIMMGYLANPTLGEEHVAEIQAKCDGAIDSEGWLHSGDKGCMDTSGMIRITGRYKEIIIGAGGENIAPVPIEDTIKSLCQGISNLVMIGNKRKFNICLVTLKSADTGGGELAGSDHLEGEETLAVNPAVTTISDAMKDEIWEKYIEDAITKTNANGDVCPSGAAKIQKFCILPHDLSVAGGELTPTLKLKRGVVEKNYSHIIDSMYDEANVKKSYIPYTAQASNEEVKGDV